MSEKKLRRTLTSAAVAASLLLTAAAGASAAEPHGRRSQVRGGGQVHVDPGDSRPFSLWKFLVSIWEKRGIGMDPDGATLRSYADSEAPTSESGSDIEQGGL
jgi:hypothetical protein